MSTEPRPEDIVPLSQVPRAFPWLPRLRGGKPVSVATLYRWAIHGVGGVKLEVCQSGGTLATTETRMRRFIERPAGGRPSDPNPSPICPDATRAERALDAAGL